MKIVSGMLGGNAFGSHGYGFSIDYSQFKNAKKILLLGDSTKDHFSMGGLLLQKYPRKKIVSTDFIFEGKEITGNFTKMHMDNTLEFPFKDNSFDTIILRRGICVCHHGKACAGFCATNHESKDFFERIIRTLDKKNPNSIAILHGEVNTPEIMNHWIQQLTELEAKYPIQVEIGKGQGAPINSIIIRPTKVNFH